MQIFGRLGLFRLGMTVMTDALRALAGDSCTRFLARFRGSPLSGFAATPVGPEEIPPHAEPEPPE